MTYSQNIVLSVDYSPFLESRYKDIYRSNWIARIGYSIISRRTFQVEPEFSYHSFAGKRTEDIYLVKRTTGFNLFGTGFAVNYYPFQKKIYITSGYNFLVNGVSNVNIVNHYGFGAGIILRSFSLRIKKNMYFNSGSLSTWSIGTTYSF